MSLHRKGLVLGILVGLIGALVTLVPAGSELEESFSLYWLFRLRGPIPPPPEVVVIAIDERSAGALGLPNTPSEWPRNIHAELVRTLTSAHPRVIAFDLIFDTASRDPANDQGFAEAMREAGNVLLVASLKREMIPVTSASGDVLGHMMSDQTLPPIARLEQAAVAHATFPLPKVSRVDTYWTFMTSAGGDPTFPALAFQIYALEAYGDFMKLWETADTPLSRKLPDTGKAVLASGNIVGAMSSLRAAVLNNPLVAERVLESVRQAPDQALAPEKKKIVEALIRLYSDDEMRYLNFYGPPRSIATVPYYKVLMAARAPQDAGSAVDLRQFEGKAVFIGYSALTQSGQARIRDDYPTVYTQPSGLRLSGVEIAATAFANLLENRAVRALPPLWQLGVMLLWGLLLGVVCRVLRPLIGIAAVVVLISVYLVAALRLFAGAGLLLPLLIPIWLQAPMALFCGALINYRDARREREAIKTTFGHFLPSAVVDQLAKSVGPMTSNNQLVYGACLSTDAENYTALAERTDPRELARLMNDYFATLFGPVTQRGGIVSDVVGDAMLAIWASSSSSASLRRDACHAALDIVEAIEKFNRADRGSSPLHTRIGLHSGQMVIGTVGAIDHYEYRAVGDIVNTTTRLEGLNKYLGTQLLASQETIDGLDEFVTRPMGTFVVAGKTVPLQVFELMGRGRDAEHPHDEWLCAVFASALADYRSGQWLVAAARFSEILVALPQDGPSRFYLQRCEHLTAHPPAGPWDATIRIDGR